MFSLGASAAQPMTFPLPLDLEGQGTVSTTYRMTVPASDLEADGSLPEFEAQALQNARAALKAMEDENASAYVELYDPSASEGQAQSMFNLAGKMFQSKGYDFFTLKYLVRLKGDAVFFGPFADGSLNLVALATPAGEAGIRQNIGNSFDPLVQVVMHALRHRADMQEGIEIDESLGFELGLIEPQAIEGQPSLRTGELFVARGCEDHEQAFQRRYGVFPVSLFNEYYTIMESIGEERFEEADFSPESLERLTPQEAQYQRPSSGAVVEFVSPLGGRNFLLVISPLQESPISLAFVNKAEDGSMTILNHNRRAHFNRLLLLPEFKTRLMEYYEEQCPPPEEGQDSESQR